MRLPSHTVKRADSITHTIGGKMHVKCSGMNGFVPQQGFNGKKVSSVFIKVCTKSVPERMAGKARFPAKTEFLCADSLVHSIGNSRAFRIFGVREKPVLRSAAGKPVIGKNLQGIHRKNGIAVRAIFGMPDMDTHVSTGNICVFESADFADTKAGRIHECKHGFMLEVGTGINEHKDLFLRGHNREKGIKSAHRKLCIVPGLMQDINGKKSELGNDRIDSPVGKPTLLLQPEDKLSHFLPGNIFGSFAQGIIQEIKISPDIGRISCNGMVSETA